VGGKIPKLAIIALPEERKKRREKARAATAAKRKKREIAPELGKRGEKKRKGKVNRGGKKEILFLDKCCRGRGERGFRQLLQRSARAKGKHHSYFKNSAADQVLKVRCF